MHFWWVNQNQTHQYEIPGGYMWSPKRNKNGARNTYYDNMVKVKPGDIVFSYFDQKISYIGVIKSNGYDHEKPEFRKDGAAWDSEGWMVNVGYRPVRNPIKPKERFETIRNLLPKKYSPLQRQTGNGLQGVYLASISDQLAKRLLILIGEESGPTIFESEEYRYINTSADKSEEVVVENIIRRSENITETEKETLIRARVGQGKFRSDVISHYGCCPITGISNPKLLKASHIKPWAKCNDHNERLDPLNGLPLSPAVDHLFDNGFLTFDDDGNMLFSDQLSETEYIAMGLSFSQRYSLNISNEKQLHYFQYHRHNIFERFVISLGN